MIMPAVVQPSRGEAARDKMVVIESVDVAKCRYDILLAAGLEPGDNDFEFILRDGKG